MSDTLSPDQQRETAKRKLRKANLLEALTTHGLTGAKAKAAARLLDHVEYDDDDEPTNLQDAIKAATAEYGEEMFKGAKVNGGGLQLTAEETTAAKAAGMTPKEYREWGDDPVDTVDEQAAAKAVGMSVEEYREWGSLGHMGSRESDELHKRLLDREDKRREDLKAAVRERMNGGKAA